MEITNLTHPSSHAMANRCGCPGFTASIGSLAQSQSDPPCDSHVECGFNWFKSHSVTVPSNATETKRAFSEDPTPLDFINDSSPSSSSSSSSSYSSSETPSTRNGCTHSKREMESPSFPGTRPIRRQECASYISKSPFSRANATHLPPKKCDVAFTETTGVGCHSTKDARCSSIIFYISFDDDDFLWRLSSVFFLSFFEETSFFFLDKKKTTTTNARIVSHLITWDNC